MYAGNSGDVAHKFAPKCSDSILQQATGLSSEYITKNSISRFSKNLRDELIFERLTVNTRSCHHTDYLAK
jgi:hypothetical protein